MSTLKPNVDFAVGDSITGPTRPFTVERVGWYSIGMLSSAAGKPMPIQFNIHTDDEYARSQGLPAAIADGMHSTNWLSSLLTEHFGEHYLARGSLRTKFIKPTYVNVPMIPHAVVTAKTQTDDGSTRYELDVWFEDASGEKLTVGDASAVVTA